MEACILCPAFHGLRSSCHAREEKVPRYCVLIGLSRDHYRVMIAERSGVPHVTPESAGPSWWGLVRQTDQPEPVAATVSTVSTVDLSLERLILHCPHRSRSPDRCGCSGLHSCAVGKGERPGLVAWADCLACVQNGGPPEVLTDRTSIG